MKQPLLALLALMAFAPLGTAAQQTADLLAWRAAYADKMANEYLDYAADLERVGAYKKAGRVYALVAKRSKDAAMSAYATLCQADTAYLNRRHFDALDTYRTALAKYPQHADFPHALRMLRLIAEDFAHGRTRGLFKGFHKKHARETYRFLIGQAPFAAQAGQDMMRLAQLERQANEINEAIDTYQLIIRRFPAQEIAVQARLALAETLLDQAHSSRDTFRLAEAAEAQVERLLRDQPDHPQALAMQTDIEQLFANHFFYLGTFYSRPVHARPEAAKRYFEMAFKAYPQSTVAPEAARRWALVDNQEAVVPSVPTQIRQKRELPPPGEVVPQGETSQPAGTADTPREDGQKWLRPLDHLGL